MEQGESWPPHFPSSACSLSFSHLQLLPTLQGTSPSGTWKSSSPHIPSSVHTFLAKRSFSHPLGLEETVPERRASLCPQEDGPGEEAPAGPGSKLCLGMEFWSLGWPENGLEEKPQALCKHDPLAL